MDDSLDTIDEAVADDREEYRDEVLSIETVVSVTLAHKRIPLQEVVDLVPGSILMFDVHCDEPLTLEVSKTPIANGATVKIGDKFGLRIRDIFSDEEEE